MHDAILAFARSHPEVDIRERIDIVRTFPYLDKNIVIVKKPEMDLTVDLDVTNNHPSDIADSLIYAIRQLNNK